VEISNLEVEASSMRVNSSCSPSARNQKYQDSIHEQGKICTLLRANLNRSKGKETLIDLRTTGKKNPITSSTMTLERYRPANVPIIMKIKAPKATKRARLRRSKNSIRNTGCKEMEGTLKFTNEKPAHTQKIQTILGSSAKS
jgi:hypothetical protein